MQGSVRRPTVFRASRRVAIIALAAVFALRSHATTVEAASPPVREQNLETVVVTGSKRSEHLLDVPSSVWAVTEEGLNRTLARDFDDLARISPSVTITRTTQPANNSINIRGVGTYAFSIATKPSVSVVVDGVPQAFQAQAFTTLEDVEQVEVLRGPQSTLFGTSATAGVINITTKAPQFRLGFGARAMVTDDGEQRVSGFLSGPLADTVRARLFVGSSFYRGTLYNTYTGRWINGQDSLTARAKMVWEPSQDSSLILAARWSDTRGSCCTSASQFVSPGVTFGRFRGYSAPQSFILDGLVPGPDNRLVSADMDPQGDATDRGGSLTFDHRLGAATLAWITGVGRYDLDDRQDTDGTSFNWGPGGAGIPGAIDGGSGNGGSFRVDSLSSELRLTSPDDGRLRYVVAAYFSQVESERDFVRGSNDLSQYGAFTTVPPTTSAYSTYSTRARARNYALFATSTFRATRRLEIVTGLRVNRELLDYSLTDRLNQTHFGQPRCFAATPSGLPASTCDDFNSVTGRAAVTFRPTPAMMVFGSYDRGYKGAAYDLTSTYTTRALVTAPGPTQGYPIGDAVASRQPVAPESVDSFQLGMKGTIRDRVSVSLTLFDASFHNYQAQSRDELTGQNMLNSVEEVRTRGVEMELTASPLRDLRLIAAGAYNSAVARKFTNAPCYSSQTAALGCVNGRQDLSGQTLANAPRWTINMDASYGLPIGADSRVLLDTGFHWKSDFMHSLLRDPMSRQGAYGILNAAIGLQRGQWLLRAFVVNALDKNFSLSKARDGNWNINPYGASAGPVTDAVKWAPGRDSARYFGVEFRTER